MGYEGFSTNKLTALVAKTTKHKRSKSFVDNTECSPEASSSYNQDTSNIMKKSSSNPQNQDSLKQEIMQLEKRLNEQIGVRYALEKALGLGHSTSSFHVNTDFSIPKPAMDLIKEISVLEMEVMHLEQYLLSLYRKTFDQPVSSNYTSKSPIRTPRRRLEFSKPENFTVESLSHVIFKESKGIEKEKILDSSVNRCYSSVSQPSDLSDPLDKAVRACHSQPLSMMKYAQNTSPNLISLAEHLGTQISDHIQETPNKLSEEMIKLMSRIYCKLTESSNTNLSSPTSSLSSTSEFSPKDQWSSSFEGIKEFSGPYNRMVEIQSMCMYSDSKYLSDIEHLLQDYKLLVSRLEEVNPRKLTHEEKLAFWINIYNALIMHAYLAYGIPQNNVKRVLLLLKAAYNVGGVIVSADMLQSSILGCRMSRPGQWLRLLLASRRKLKASDDRQGYAIQRLEPLLHFSLCSGTHSDPAVRVYTPKRIYEEMESAKEEYIRANFGVRKDRKIVLPKVVECFARDSGVCGSRIMEMVQQSLPESLRKSIKKAREGKSSKNIEWVPHNFGFRYLIVKELGI